jgi:hypothetical protein
VLGAALVMLAAAAAPSSAAPSTPATDARQIAQAGTVATLTPLMEARETEHIIAQHPELTAAEQDQLRMTGNAVAADHTAKLVDAEAQALLANLSPEDLRALAAFTLTPAAQHLREHLPRIAYATMTLDRDYDFEAEVAKAFCAKSGKLCVK